MANFVNIDGVNIEDQLLATQDSAGLLSAEDKIKIDTMSELVGDTAVSTQISQAIDAIPRETVIINITGNTTDGFSMDKTYDEIKTAYDEGYDIYIKYINEADNLYLEKSYEKAKTAWCL